MSIHSLLRESRKSFHHFFRQSFYRNFAWDVSWVLCWACNSQCDYCPCPHADTVKPDISRALETVIKFNPRYLSVAGGEIFIHPEIEAIFQKLRAQCPKAWIFAVTNFHTTPEKIEACIRCFDCLLVSVDSYGEHNRIHRMIDGDVVMEKLRAVRSYVSAHGLPVRFITNSVITVKNCMHIEEFVRRMQRLIPGQEMGFTTVNPYTHPLSLGSDKEKAREVLSSIRRLQGEGHPVWFSELAYIVESLAAQGVPVKAGEVDSLQLPREVICKRQYFRVQVLPDGSVLTCKPHLHIDAYHRAVEEALGEGRYLRGMRLYLAMLKSLLIRKYDPRCFSPCNCEYFMESLFYDTPTPERKDAFNVFGGKFTKAEVEKADRFLARHYGRGFPADMRNAMHRSGER